MNIASAANNTHTTAGVW